MSGHNKWSKIKHKKAASDAQKSKAFSKISKVITIEAKASGGDIHSPGLRLAIEKAKAANMPNTNIDRAIKKATETNAATMERVTYEAYGPGGTAIIIEGLTDNRNRAAAEVRHILSKHSIELAAQGAAVWAFTKTDNGWETKTGVDISSNDEKKLESIVEDLEESDEVQEVFINAS